VPTEHDLLTNLTPRGLVAVPVAATARVSVSVAGWVEKGAAASAFRQPFLPTGSTLTAVGRTQLCNSLPGFIPDPRSSIDCFRRLLKTYLFARY